jgi:hypothetical protein
LFQQNISSRGANEREHFLTLIKTKHFFIFVRRENSKNRESKKESIIMHDAIATKTKALQYDYRETLAASQRWFLRRTRLAAAVRTYRISL